MNLNSDQVYDSSRLAPAPIEEARELFRYRNLVLQFIRRDLVARYKRSLLGVTWTMLNPLGTMLVLSLVFSQVFKTSKDFPVYILSGLLAWTFFSVATSDSMINLIGGVNLLQRIYTPPTIFSVSAVGNGIVNLLLSLIPLLLVMLALKVPPHLSVIFLPVSILFLASFALGIGLLVSTFAVYFRDVTALYQIILTAWFYLTPIIYPVDLLQPSFQFWISILNPMYSLVNLFRIPLYEGRFPNAVEIYPAAFFAFTALIVGWLFFTLRSREFAYRI
jgi:ABC-type polysaccharide/polyol phosphate export permease